MTMETCAVHTWQAIEGYRGFYRCSACKRTGYGSGLQRLGPDIKEHKKQDPTRFQPKAPDPDVRVGTGWKKPSLDDYDGGR